MSFRGNRNFSGRSSVPSQIFKKRHILFDTSVPTGSDATLLAELVVDETGTIYSVKVEAQTNSLAAAGGDTQRISLWVRCARAGAALPDFTSSVESDTINGFHVGCIWGVAPVGQTISSKREKYRFRRKCDENMLIQLIAQSTVVNTTGRQQDISGSFSYVLRTR